MKDPYAEYDSKKAAASLNAYELPRKPGESQEYSNFAVSVLGYLVAQNAETTYEELLQEKIAKPLKMKDCTIELSADQKKRFATPHEQFGSPTNPWSFADLPGAGGIRANMRDMMRFAKAHLDPPKGALGEAIELAWKQHRKADASGHAMGLGWILAHDGQTRWHNGGTGGFRSTIFINRDVKCAVVILCNTAAENQLEPLATKILMKAAGMDVPLPKENKDDKKDVAKIDAKHRSQLVGQYQLAPNFIFDVKDKDGHLMVGITNQPTLEVFPDSPTLWSYRGIDAKLEFKLDKTGPAPSLVLIQNGARQQATRVNANVKIDAEQRKRLVGRYQLTPNFIFNVKDKDGHLMVGITNQPTLEVFPTSPTNWLYRGVEAKLEFKMEKAGQAMSLVLHQNGAEQTAKRMK